MKIKVTTNLPYRPEIWIIVKDKEASKLLHMSPRQAEDLVVRINEELKKKQVNPRSGTIFINQTGMILEEAEALAAQILAAAQEVRRLREAAVQPLLPDFDSAPPEEGDSVNTGDPEPKSLLHGYVEVMNRNYYE